MDTKTAILSTLVYFDLFAYPVTEKEIYFFLTRTVTPAAFERGLRELTGEGLVFSWEGLYSVRNDSLLVQRRRTGNALASDMLKTARKVATLIARFPFVRGVGVSGSLSKQFADGQSDIDLFIITARNRLWIARTLLHLLKKAAFLIHREDWFCMNYFIDEAAMEIPEKNLYTAIETVTLIPMRGSSVFGAFSNANRWTKRWLPNAYDRRGHAEEGKPSLLKRAVECMCNNAFGDHLDTWLMKVTADRWKKKTRTGKTNNRGVVMSMDASRHVARPDPVDYQGGLLQSYNLKVAQLLHKYAKIN